MKRISGGQLSREAKPRFYQVTPAVLGRRRTTQALPVRPKQSTQQSRVSPPPARGPTGRVGRHRPDAHHSDSDSSLTLLRRVTGLAAMRPRTNVEVDRWARPNESANSRSRQASPRPKCLQEGCKHSVLGFATSRLRPDWRSRPASRRLQGGHDGMQNRSAAYAERPGRCGAGRSTAPLGSIVGGDWNVAIAIVRAEGTQIVKAFAGEPPGAAGLRLERVTPGTGPFTLVKRAGGGAACRAGQLRPRSRRARRT